MNFKIDLGTLHTYPGPVIPAMPAHNTMMAGLAMPAVSAPFGHARLVPHSSCCYSIFHIILTLLAKCNKRLLMCYSDNK